MTNEALAQAEEVKLSLWRQVRWPLFTLVLGLTALCALGLLEHASHADQFWGDALMAIDGSPLWDGTRPIAVRMLPDGNLSPSAREFVRQLEVSAVKDLLPGNTLALALRERIVSISIAPEEWSKLLASGRAPEPGKREAAAGNSVRFDQFTLDGETYTVVGRIDSRAPCFGFAYVIPDAESNRSHFTDEAGALKGWFDPRGIQRLDEEKPTLESEHKLTLIGGMAPVGPGLALGAMAALLAMAVGGCLVQVRLLRGCTGTAGIPAGFLQEAGRDAGGPSATYLNLLFGAFLDELRARPRLLWSVHVLHYGCLFLFMGLALAFPRVNMLMVNLVRGAFTEGSLSHVGDAYASGNILRAAWATFAHNYLYATVLVAIIPSLAIPFAGLLINQVRFCIVGFSMAPIWSGFISHYSYHSITMVLELEPYILASFLVCLLPIRIVRGLRSGEVVNEAVRALRAMLGGTLLVGVMLALAALYEAVTLTLLR